MTKPIPYALYGRKSALTERFIRYASIPTASDPEGAGAPSAAKELVLARVLADELRALGFSGVSLDACGIVMATLPAAPGCEALPVLALISHMDTSPEASDGPLRPQVACDWAGEPIVLNEEAGITLSAEVFPELLAHRGEDILCTDGTTLLGADDKAGIAAIIEAAAWYLAHPEAPHPEVRLCFTPDEEIGRGTENLKLSALKADYAFTVDGGEVGGLESETFNAAEATVRFTGVSVHPGSAKGKMVNALKLASRFLEALPAAESPEATEGHEGFYHPTDLAGSVEKATLKLIIRDHDAQRFEARKAWLSALAKDFDTGRAPAVCLEIRDQYKNMRAYLAGHEDVLELARAAIREAGIEPVEEPVRGGTDGAFLSAAGLPCPNLFTGGLNFHGIYECLPVESLEKAARVVKNVIGLAASRQ